MTRRLGWKFAKAGDVYCAIEKGQGLKKGEKVNRLCQIRIVSARQEPLDAMLNDLEYGFLEIVREGFEQHPTLRWPTEFVSMFCSHNKCTPSTEITRLQFEYVRQREGRLNLTQNHTLGNEGRE